MNEKSCPKCGRSSDFHETVSLEWCDHCGYSFNYWTDQGHIERGLALMSPADKEKEQRIRKEKGAS